LLKNTLAEKNSTGVDWAQWRVKHKQTSELGPNCGFFFKLKFFKSSPAGDRGISHLFLLTPNLMQNFRTIEHYRIMITPSGRKVSEAEREEKKPIT
jgi:hypothetical protein